MTPTTPKIERCKYCKDKSDIDLQRFVVIGGTAYKIYCRNCGTQSDRRSTPQQARDSWNDLHTPANGGAS